MTDLQHHTDTEIDLGTASDRVTALEMDLAWTQQQRTAAEAREQFAEAARRAATERADLAEQAVRQLLAAHYIGPAADDEGVPCPEGEDLAAIAETLYGDWAGGVSLADLDARALVRGWAEETGRG
jgi:hypothetical protein